LVRSQAGLGIPHSILVDLAREAISSGAPESLRERALCFAAGLLQPVINATGVLLHTNLGRAPIGVVNGSGYSNVEFDLRSGKRMDRQSHVRALLCALTGAEAALVVNNGAAAIMLAVSTLARGRKVVVSRGELVEIGGGFRISELLAVLGLQLVEVGSTNRTHLQDYCDATHDGQCVILKVHPSNYQLSGFTKSVDIDTLRQLNAPVIFDIGSGLLDARTPWLPGGPPGWLSGEPAVRQSISQGADVVTFSADKLMGGPQAGIIVGSSESIGLCVESAIYRALRPGQGVLEALQGNLLAYMRHDGAAIPFWRIASLTLEELSRRAHSIGVGDVVDCYSVVGGGSVPGSRIPSIGVALRGDHAEYLRSATVPIIARVIGGVTVADLRTVDPREDELVKEAFENA
jgi:L-seryl-tRNA(Ser) seleniumtransferase